MPDPRCGATYSLDNGETVTPCHLPSGHRGDHEGYCLGSRAVWASSKQHDSEEEQRIEYAERMDQCRKCH